jgi:hypothetical protein
MKSKSIILSVLLLFAVSLFTANSQSKSFIGEWKLNKEKTVLTDANLFLSKITINLRNDSILTVRTYENANGEEYPFTENMPLNGKETKMTIYEMPRTSMATKSADGSLQIKSVTTFQGNGGEDNLTTDELWKIEADGKSISMNYSSKMSAGVATGVSYFTKTK